MKYRILMPILASIVLAAPALADAPAPPDMARHHAEMCSHLYAGAVGKLATLEVELKLTATQKPLFERWKNVKLDGAKAHADKCATMKMPDHDISIVEGMKFEMKMLEARLAALKAEAPSLEALVNALDKDQQATFKRAARHAMHDRAGAFGRMFDRGMHRGGPHHDMDGDMVMPPPPPEH